MKQYLMLCCLYVNNETILTVVLFISYSLQRRVELGMSLALIVVTFFPASGIVFRVGFVIAERCVLIKKC